MNLLCDFTPRRFTLADDPGPPNSRCVNARTTNLVDRPSRGIDDLSRQEMEAGAALLREKLRRLCRTNEVGLFCNHGTAIDEVDKSRILVAYFALLGLEIAAASWTIARGYVGGTIAVWGLLAFLTTIVAFWRTGEQPRRTAALQVAACFTVVGLAAVAPLDGAAVGAVLAISCLSVGGIIVGAYCGDSYGLTKLLQLAFASASVVLLIAGVSILPSSRSFAFIFLASSAAATLAFCSSFLQNSISLATRHGLPTESHIPMPSPIPRIELPRARPASGVVGSAITLANTCVTAAEACGNAARVTINFVIGAVFKLVQFVELHISRAFIRIAQIVHEMLLATLVWARETWDMLDDTLLPNTLGPAGFAAASILAWIGTEKVIAYVGSGEGFSTVGWLRLASPLGLALGSGICLAVGWSSYVDSKERGVVNGLYAFGPTAFFLFLYTAVLASMATLVAVIGLPLLRLMPPVESLLSGSPYDFGPASLLATLLWTVIVAYVVTLLLVRPAQEKPADSTDQQSELPTFMELIRLLISLAKELRPVSLAASTIAVCAVAALLTILPALSLGQEADSQVEGAAIVADGTYDVELPDGRACSMTFTRDATSVFGQTDCTGIPETCLGEWDYSAQHLAMACSSGTTFELDSKSRGLEGTAAGYGWHSSVHATHR